MLIGFYSMMIYSLSLSLFAGRPNTDYGVDTLSEKESGSSCGLHQWMCVSDNGARSTCTYRFSCWLVYMHIPRWYVTHLLPHFSLTSIKSLLVRCSHANGFWACRSMFWIAETMSNSCSEHGFHRIRGWSVTPTNYVLNYTLLLMSNALQRSHHCNRQSVNWNLPAMYEMHKIHHTKERWRMKMHSYKLTWHRTQQLLHSCHIKSFCTK